MAVSPRHTLGYLSIHPIRQSLDVSATPLATVGAQVKAYMNQHNNKDLANPDEAAVTFYGFQQMIAVLSAKFDRNEPLPADDLATMDAYLNWTQSEAIRAAMYLLVIVIRESRHTFTNESKDNLIAKEVGFPVVKWLRQYASGENYSSLWTDPPQATLGQLATAIRRFFYEHKFSSGYGGPKWGAVADCLESYVYGRTSLEIMLDTNWTLSHNNGPIFNKGMLYSGYSGYLLSVLDVQRAGMILEGILESHAVTQQGTTPKMRVLTEEFVERHSECFERRYIDWYEVQALGAVNNCASWQKKQVEKYGPTAKSGEAEKLAYEQAKAKKAMADLLAAKKAMDEAEFLLHHYQVDNDTFVKKINRAD